MKRNDILSAVKAMRKARREEEIALHGKPLRIGHVAVSKKQYTRKQKHKMNASE